MERNVLCTAGDSGRFLTAGAWQGLREQGVRLEDLARLIAGGGLRVSQLVIVQGLSDLGFDLFCNPDAYRGFKTFLASDGDTIRRDIDDNCGEVVFDRTFAAYVEAVADHHGRTVSRLVRQADAKCDRERRLLPSLHLPPPTPLSKISTPSQFTTLLFPLPAASPPSLSPPSLAARAEPSFPCSVSIPPCSSLLCLIPSVLPPLTSSE